MALTMKEKYARVDLAKLPEDLRKEFEGIKDDSDNFDPELTPIFENNFKDAYSIAETYYPDSIKKGGTIKKVRPVKVKKPVAKSKAKKAEPVVKEMVHKSRGKFESPQDLPIVKEGLATVSDVKFVAKILHESINEYSSESFVDKVKENTSLTKNDAKAIYRDYKSIDDPKKEGYTNSYKWYWAINNAILENKKPFIPRSRGKNKPEPEINLEECRKIFSEAGYTIKKKPSKSGTKVMKVKVQRQERTIIKDKVDDTFKTILKDVSGSKEKDEKYLKMQKALSELQQLMTKLFNLLNNLAEDNSVEKVEKIISLMKKLVP